MFALSKTLPRDRLVLTKDLLMGPDTAADGHEMGEILLPSYVRNDKPLNEANSPVSVHRRKKYCHAQEGTAKPKHVPQRL